MIITESHLALARKIEFAVVAFAKSGTLSSDAITLLREAAIDLRAVPTIGGRYGCDRAVEAEFFLLLSRRFEFDVDDDGVAAMLRGARETLASALPTLN
jgi:hypothetical protein